ncbi:MAG: serine protease [bacterium]|nr:serine protease [bacterium]
MFKYCFFVGFLILFLTSNNICFSQGGVQMQENVPIATGWLLNATDKMDRSVIKSVYLIFCPKTSMKGTGFLLESGQIITNEHVIRGCQATDIVAISSFGEKVLFNKLSVDTIRDLAVLFPKIKLDSGLTLDSADNTVLVGTVVSTWGFPLGYNGPAPLLSVGYLSGYKAELKGTNYIKHLVVNGAFNPGNSGGPLFQANDNKIIGIVVSKHLPMSQFQLSALRALANHKTGFMFNATDEKGNKIEFSESQLVADLLEHFKSLTQVMIGEAISVSELRTFLNEQGIK